MAADVLPPGRARLARGSQPSPDGGRRVADRCPTDTFPSSPIWRTSFAAERNTRRSVDLAAMDTTLGALLGAGMQRWQRVALT